MLSKTSARLLVFAVKWTSLWGGMPYVWDDRRAMIRISRRNRMKWNLYMGFSGIVTFYSLLRLVWLMKCVDGTLIEKIRLFLATMISFLNVLFGVNTWFFHRDMAAFVNSYVKFAQHYRNAYVRKLGRGWRNGCEGFLRTCFISAVFFPILPALLYLFKPDDMMYVTSLLPRKTPLALRGVALTLYGALHFTWFASAASIGVFYFFANFIPAFLMNGVIPESMPGLGRYMTRPVVRRPPRLCQLYRTFQIFASMLNAEISHVLFPFKVFSIFFQVVCMATLVNFWKEGVWIGKILLITFPNTFLVTWLVIVSLSGSILTRTQDCINSWSRLKLKLPRDKVYMRKFRKSCRPLRIRVSHFYYIRPVQLIISINSVLKNFFKLSLALRKLYLRH